LAVIEDAIRDDTPAAIVGEVGRVSMVATRRLQLAAADADLPALLLRRRRGREQDPVAEPSATWTRWRIASAPSVTLYVAGASRACLHRIRSVAVLLSADSVPHPGDGVRILRVPACGLMS
jgi:protein ImuA